MSEKKQTWQDELDTLLARLVDEELSTTDTKRLNEILSDNPAARDHYHVYMDVHEALQEQFSIPDFTALDKVVTPEPEPSYRRTGVSESKVGCLHFSNSEEASTPN